MDTHLQIDSTKLGLQAAIYPAFGTENTPSHVTQLPNLEPSLSARKMEVFSKIFDEIHLVYGRLNDQTTQTITKKIEMHLHSLKKEKKTVVIEIIKELFIVAKAIQDKVKTIEIFRRSVLIQEGGWAYVHLLKNVRTQQVSNILKEAIADLDSKFNKTAAKKICNELYILSLTNSEGSFPCLQAAPKITFEYTPYGSNKTIIAYDNVKLEGDCLELFNLHDLTVADKLNLTDQILHIRKTLRDLNLYHGDIKRENLLYKKENDGRINLILIDFGNSIQFHNFPYRSRKWNQITIKDFGKGVTQRNFCKQLVESIQSKRDKFELAFCHKEDVNDEVLKYFNDDLQPLLAMCEDFAWGLVLYILWAERPPPYESFSIEGDQNTEMTCIETDKTEIREIMEAELEINGASKAISDTILEFLTPKYN